MSFLSDRVLRTCSNFVEKGDIYMRKLVSALLTMVLLFTSFTVMPVTSVLAEGEGSKTVDPATVNGWTEVFKPTTTEHAGGVWTDKSVFASANEYIAATNESEDSESVAKLQIDEDNFLVSLSAMASTKSIVGYSSIPTDTMLVLDMSTSMINNRSIDELTIAANKAMQELLSLNNHNRVGVVVYAGNTTGGFSQNAPGATVVLLPLDRYTSTTDVDRDGKNDYLSYSRPNERSEWNTMFVVDGVKNSAGNSMRDRTKTTSSGTFIQDGIYVALQQFLRSDIETTISEGQIQAGTERLPIMVIMTDGEPTLAVRDYDGNNGSLGSNELRYTDDGYHDITFLSQLTASYAKQQVDSKYVSETPLFYTLGLNVDEREALVMNPDPGYENGDSGLIARFNNYWEELKRDGTVELVDARNSVDDLRYDAEVIRELEKYRSYSDGYYSAENEQGLLEAFEEIVTEIILQSLYYPTLVKTDAVHGDGYLTFTDIIGHNMEVKGFKGIQLGDKLYDGSKLAQLIVTGSAGTVENPSEIGDNLVWALTERLGLTRVQDTPIVRQLIVDAYNAGQISYNASTGEFSNYVGWFGNSNGKYLGFWDGTEAGLSNAPADAVAANKSYLFLDAVGEGHRETDILYASVQVSETIKTYTSPRGVTMEAGESLVYAKLPASLIPLVEYHVELEGSDPTKPTKLEVKGADAPSRLIYEVGLDSKIDLLNIKETAPHASALNLVDGNYVFYTNQWNADWTNTDPWINNTYAMFEPSHENEHYYFNEKTMIYSDKNGTEATSLAGSGPYYRRHLEYTVSNNTVNATYVYTQISSEVIKSAVQDGNNYYVDKGTIHRYVSDHVVYKGPDSNPNPTGTVQYSSYPYIHHVDNPGVNQDVYHVDDILGNNGKLTVPAYEGIKLTKKIDSTLIEDSTEYEFVLNADVPDGQYTLVKEMDGIRTNSQVSFTNKEATIQLKANETAYILGSAFVGKIVNVKETETGTYKVSSIVGGTVSGNSTQVTVGDNTITNVTFTNTKVVDGDVIIEKTVVSDHDAHKEPNKFKFTITLEGNNLETEYPAEKVVTYNDRVERISGKLVKYENSSNEYRFKADSVTTEPSIGVELGHNDYLHITGLKPETRVTAEEVNLPSGFTKSVTVNGNALTSGNPEATVVAGATQYIHTTNTYSPSATDSVKYNLSITKEFKAPGFSFSTINGNKASFEFKLEQYDDSHKQYVQVGNDIVIDITGVDTNGIGTASTTKELNLSYDKPGSYSYRITEIPSNAYPGVVYDPVECFFTVEVTDPGDGKLVISNVIAGNDTIIDNTGKTISANFNNEYIVDGYAEAVIEIQKSMEYYYTDEQNTQQELTGVSIPVEGFEFEVYETGSDYVVEANKTPIIVVKSDATGKALFNRVYTQSDLRDHYYVIKEVKKDGKHPNGTLTYDETVYKVHVKAGTSSEGTNVVPTISVDVYKNDEATPNTYKPASTTGDGSAHVKVNVPLAFTNKYSPDPVALAIPVSGTKNFSGWPNSVNYPDGLKFTFELYHRYTDSAGQPKEELFATLEKKASDLSGKNWTFIFNEEGKYKKFTKPGTFTLVLKEFVPADGVKYPGVTYDTTEYVITVNVTSDANGKLHASITDIEADGKDAVIQFNNSYEAAPVTAKIQGTKTLVSDLWTLNPNTFSFELFEADANHNITNNTAIQRVNNGNADGTAGKFEFNLNYDKAGTYNYVVKEVIPSEANAANNYTVRGIKFDPTAYKVTVTVTDSGVGNLQANVVIADDNDNIADFTNKYSATSATTEITGTKNVDGAKLTAVYENQTFQKFFEFELYKAKVVHGDWTGENSLVETVKIENVLADTTGTFKFTKLEFTKPGDYYYIVKEKAVNTDPNIVYDPREYRIRVNVADNLDGTLVAHQTVMITGNNNPVTDITYSNTVHAEEIQLILKADKLLENWPTEFNSQAPEFTFNLYLANDQGKKVDANPLTPEVLDVALSTTVKGTGEVVFEDSQDELATPYLRYTQPGTYYYIIEESIPSEATNNKLNGIAFDPTSYLVEVKVELTKYDQSTSGRDELKETVTYYELNGSSKTPIDVDDIDFINKYDPTKTSVTFNAKKVLIADENTGKSLEDYNGKFVLGLFKADELGNIIETEPTYQSKNNLDKFEIQVEYDKPSVHYYVLKEVDGGISTITYDDTELRIRVTVSDENGVLKAETEYFVDNRWESADAFAGTELVFTNEFHPTEVTIDIEKVLKFTSNGKHGLSGFQFSLKEEGDEPIVALSDTNGEAKFVLLFNESHLGANNSSKTYKFTLSEVDQKEKDMVYDTTKYEIELEVKVNSEGKLIVTKKDSDVAVSKIDFTFTNTFNGSEDVPEKPVDPTPSVVVPNTGDDSNVPLYGAMMLICALLMAILFVVQKKRELISRH